VEKFSSEFLSKKELFYIRLEKRDFKNYQYLPVFQDKQTNLMYFLCFNILNCKNTGHCLIFNTDNSKIELILANKNSKNDEGIIYFNNGDVFIGNLTVERKSFLNFIDVEPVKQIDLQLNDNYKKKRFSFNKEFSEKKTNDKLIENPINFEDPFKNLENNLNLSHLEKIVNVYPTNEGIYIRKYSCEVIFIRNWDLNGEKLAEKLSKFSQEKKIRLEEFQNFNSNDNCIFENFLNFFDTDKAFKNALIYDYLNNSRYEGEVLFKNKEFLKHGKGKLEFLNTQNYYEGEWKNNLFHGEGILYEKNNILRNHESTFTKGIWLNGKLNGNGFITFENSKIKEKFIWRFGRIVNHLKVLHMPVKLNEEIFNFLNNNDLTNFICIKNRSFLNYFKKNKLNLIDFQENQNKFLKSKGGKFPISSNSNKNNLNTFFAIDNFIGKNSSTSINGKEEKVNLNFDKEAQKSPINNFLEENKESDIYVDCISNEDALIQVKLDEQIPQKNLITNGGETFENEVPYDPEFNEENRELYNFINEKYKEVEPFLNRDWKLMEEKKDFKSFNIDEASGLRSIKTEIIIRVNHEKVKEFMMDLSQRHKFNKNLDVIKNIRVIGKSYYLKYMKLKSVLILSARDFIFVEKVCEVT